MAFSLREFLKSGLLLAVGQKPDYEIKLKSADWLDKGVLLEEDLAEIQEAIDGRNTIVDVTEKED